MSSTLKVLFVATEVNPLAKVGGLADVIGALPAALRKLGLDVRVAMPRYNTIDMAKHGPAESVTRYEVSLFGRSEQIDVSKVSLRDGTPVYLLGNQTYFARAAVYGEKDDLERFLLLSVAAVELPDRLGWKPDVLHCHDWHTGLGPVLWKRRQSQSPASSASASVFTVHNLGYQGNFDDWFASKAGLRQYLPPESDPIRPKVWSMMGLAILAADAVSTVSPTYAREVLTPEYGFQLHEVLQRRQADLSGILNGIDYEEFDPAKDRVIPFKYNAQNLKEKGKNKAVLQKRAGLDESPEAPVAGMVGRLADQKGLDLVASALEQLLIETDVQFVLLGSGDEKYRSALDGLSGKYPTRMCLTQGFDIGLAQLIYAGCDLFLMPSRYEPCGLGQMIALKYGTIPVVRQTGGLADSIEDCSADLSRGNGFTFREYRKDKFIEALQRADTAFHRKSEWRKLVVRAMKSDFSWDVSARKYVEMYEKAVRKARSGV